MRRVSAAAAIVLTLCFTPEMAVATRAQEASAARAHKNRLMNTTLNVRDLAASLRFFTEGLGMRERGRHVPSKGVTEVSLGYGDEGNGALIMLAHREARTTPYERGEWGRLIFEVVDVRATVDRVVRAGGKLARGAADVASAPVVVAIVEDPDGHQFELVQFK